MVKSSTTPQPPSRWPYPLSDPEGTETLEVFGGHKYYIYILIHIYIYIYTHTHTRTRTHTHTHAHPASTSTSKYTYNIIIYIISYTYRIYADTYTSTYTYTYTCVLKEGSIISESHLKRWIEMVSCKHSDQFQFQSTVIHSSGLQWSSLGRLRQTWQNHRSWLANPRTQWKLTSYSRDNTIPYHYHYITLHYITLHYSTLQYITVHYHTYHTWQSSTNWGIFQPGLLHLIRHHVALKLVEGWDLSTCPDRGTKPATPATG